MVEKPGKYTVWTDAMTENWYPTEFETKEAALEHIAGGGITGAFRITKEIVLGFAEERTGKE